MDNSEHPKNENAAMRAKLAEYETAYCALCIAVRPGDSFAPGFDFLADHEENCRRARLLAQYDLRTELAELQSKLAGTEKAAELLRALRECL
jgi:hypothetical protein